MSHVDVSNVVLDSVSFPLRSHSIPAAISLLEGMAEVLGEDTQDIDVVSRVH